MLHSGTVRAEALLYNCFSQQSEATTASDTGNESRGGLFLLCSQYFPCLFPDSIQKEVACLENSGWGLEFALVMAEGVDWDKGTEGHWEQGDDSGNQWREVGEWGQAWREQGIRGCDH